jgi:hypothetical protein
MLSNEKNKKTVPFCVKFCFFFVFVNTFFVQVDRDHCVP